jgi:Phage capsid family
MSQAPSSRTYSDDRTLLARKRLKPADVLVRAATCELTRNREGPNHWESVANVIARRYGGCPATEFYIRAVTSPAATTTTGWAAELVDQAVVSFLAVDMARTSGFAQLAQRALTVTLDGVGSVKVPSRASPLTLMGAWIGESNAKPVFPGVLTATTLTPYKLSAISTFTEEMTLRTMIEQIVRETLAHDLGALLDTAAFDATAASAVRPAGLFNGATAVTASAATPPQEAMIADLKGLAAAVSGTGNPDASVVYVVNPAQAIRINLLAPQYANLIVSGYMTAGAVGAIDTGAVAMIVGQPIFAVSRDATLHFETSPTALGAVGSPNTIAAPTRSLYQEDLVGLRCVLRAGWVKRRATATALASSVTW